MGWLIFGIPLLIFIWTAITSPLMLVTCILVTGVVWAVLGAFDDMDGEASSDASDADKKEDK
jgi:hypothetical protein